MCLQWRTSNDSLWRVWLTRLSKWTFPLKIGKFVTSERAYFQTVCFDDVIAWKENERIHYWVAHAYNIDFNLWDLIHVTCNRSNRTERLSSHWVAEPSQHEQDQIWVPVSRQPQRRSLHTIIIYINNYIRTTKIYLCMDHLYKLLF